MLAQESRSILFAFRISHTELLRYSLYFARLLWGRLWAQHLHT